LLYDYFDSGLFDILLSPSENVYGITRGVDKWSLEVYKGFIYPPKIMANIAIKSFTTFKCKI